MQSSTHTSPGGSQHRRSPEPQPLPNGPAMERVVTWERSWKVHHPKFTKGAGAASQRYFFKLKYRGVYFSCYKWNVYFGSLGKYRKNRRMGENNTYNPTSPKPPFWYIFSQHFLHVFLNSQNHTVCMMLYHFILEHEHFLISSSTLYSRHFYWLQSIPSGG